MKLIKWLDEHLEEYLLILLSAFTVVVIGLQVFMRYALSNSLTWSEEIARYAFIWMIFIGVSYAVKKDKHLIVDAFILLFERKGKIIVAMIANVLFLIFAIVMTYYGYDIVLLASRESAAMQIPLSWVYLAPVVGLGLTTIRLIQKLVQQAKELKAPHVSDEEEQPGRMEEIV